MNAPPSGYYFTNSQGQRIHVRYFLPSSEKARAVLFFAHGYAAHCNRQWSYINFFERLSENGFAVFAHDHRGHGYSDGVRALVESMDLLADDWSQLITAVTTRNKYFFQKTFSNSLSYDWIERLASLPYFLSATSMGGLVSLTLLKQLQQRNEELSQSPSQFSLRDPVGLVMFCPLTIQPSAHSFLFRVGLWIASSLFGSWQMPGFLDPTIAESDDGIDAYNRTELGACRLEEDTIEKGGLGYKGSLRWRTAWAFVDGACSVKLEELGHMKCPVLCFHDPEDRVTNISNSIALISAFKHPGSSLIAVPDGRHDLFGNDEADIRSFIDSIVKWVGIVAS